MEHYGAISYIKEYYQEFKKSTVSVKYSYSLIICFDKHVVQILVDIQLSKILCAIESWNKIRDERKWIFVLDYNIKNSIILYQLKQAILFLIKNTSVVMEDFEFYIGLI